MITLTAKTRKATRKKVANLRDGGIIPGVLYGPKIENLNLEVNQKEFEKIYQEAGESSLISLEVGTGKKFLVLIHGVQTDPITSKILHIDFLQPSLTDPIEADVPVIFTGEASAVKDLGGTLIKNISEIKVEALPEKLPHEIKVDVSLLKNFDDNILVKNMILPEGVKVLKGQDDIIAFVASPQKVEEELERPIEEKVEEVGKVEKEKKEEATEETKEKTS